MVATDPSTTTSCELLTGNLAALWSVDPVLAAQVDAIDESTVLPLEPSRTGAKTAAVDSAAGQRIYLHSRYDPVDEAARQVTRIAPDRLEIFLCGLGLGYHVAALRSRASEAAIWVFEPDVRVIRAALEVNDLSEALLARKLRIIPSPDKAALSTEWMPHLAGMSVGQDRIEHPPSLQLHPEFFAGVRTLIDEFIAFGKTTINTMLLNGRRTCENLARNIPWYVSAPGIGRLRDALKGHPAIIVSAGPSLRKNKHLLKHAKGQAAIIAVQTTFQQLLDLEVEPDFVTSLDYHDICTQFFQQVPRHVRTELIAEPKATTKIFSLNPGPVSLLGNDFIDRILRELRLDRPRLQAGATVAHLAFYLAQHLGCDPIIFVGQDLGFSEGLAYAPGTSYDDLWRPELGRYNTMEMLQWQRIVRDRHILRRVPDYQGRPTYTEERLFTYLQQFERDFARSEARIIDATEGGAAKRGTVVMTLQDALNTYCRRPLNISLPAHPGLDRSRLSQAETSLRTRLQEAVQIEQISTDTLPLLREIADSLENQGRVNDLIGKVDRLRSRMNELGATYDLITQLTQQSELDRFAADRRIAAAGIDAAERQRRQVLRDLDNVRHVISAAGAFQSLMRESADLVAQAVSSGGKLR